MAAKLLGERLPPQWSYGVSSDGRIFFINDQVRQTSWLHPLTGEPVQTGYTTLPDDSDSDLDDLPHDLVHLEVRMSSAPNLPAGWEQALTIDGTVYFIDHNRHRTTFDHPITGRPVMDPPNRTPPQSPLTKGNQSRKGSGKQRHVKAPPASRGENSKVILRGWLQKQESGTLKLWKKKWCVLADFGLFFYKDEGEQNCIGSILLPSYSINPCRHSDVNKKFAFKAEHENMKTFYFAADNQTEMAKWVEALRMASLVQRAPGSGQMEKLIPKSPIMRWNDELDSPGVAPPDMQQYPFSGSSADTTPRGGPHDMDSSFRSDRYPLQPRENTQNFNDSYSSQGPRTDGSQQGPEFGTFPRDNRGQGYGGSNRSSYDPRYPDDRMDRNRSSQRSNQSQGHRLPDDQRSMSSVSQRSNQPSFSTLPRDMRPNTLDTSMRSQTSSRGQGYNSLPRDSRSKLSPDDGQDRPYGHSSPRQPQAPGSGQRGYPLQGGYPGHGQEGQGQPMRRKEDNPYMMMASPYNQQRNERKMDPNKHSNRPLPQEPIPEPVHERMKSGGGDYASLTRIRDKWPNQKLSDSQGERERTSRDMHDNIEPQQASVNHLSPTQQQRPDLYVDIPHTYVNVYDQSQVRDNAPELPSRPPLPTEVRQQIVEDIAKTHSPNTQHELIMAENNLELRMKQPAFFNYPTPTRESLPPFPQDSPRSQYSQRSQKSHRSTDPRSQQPQLPRRPDVAPMSSQSDARNSRHNMDDTYLESANKYEQNYNTSTLSKDLDGSDTTLTNEDERNDKISEFYGLGKYNTKNKPYDQRNDKSRFMSDMDVRANTLPSNTLPSKPKTGVTGEKDFRLRSLPDHVQSMPALYQEQQPLSIYVPDRQQVINSYANLAPPPGDASMMNGNVADDSERRSAFRPLSSTGSNSLQRIPSGDMNSMTGYSDQGRSGDYGKPYRYPDQEQTDIKPLSSANTHMSQPQSPWNQEKPSGQGYGQGSQGQGQRGKRSAPAIHTVREEPDMPDSQVIETELPKRVFPLNGPRLRMSISATDLLGKTHDELVLLLIQLRRDKAELNEQRDGIRKTIEQNRPAEFYYRKLQNEGRLIDDEKEMQHRQYQDMKHKLEDVEKRLEVYKPLVNLVCNMVTMGSLYGGDNLMLATEYRKHLLSPEQYSPPKKMLEFSRRNQEDRIIQGIEDDVKQLTQEQADLEEKLERLYTLDRIMQEQSFQVTSLKEDREMLEKALGGLLKKQDQHCTNPRELDILVQQQKTIEKELSRVLQQLAEASKELEETTAENNKLEHEVALLRSNVHGNVTRSKSAPSLSSESVRTKMKMEKDLAKVKNIMEGLSEEGARLQEMMTSLRKPRTSTDLPTSPTATLPRSLPMKAMDQWDSAKRPNGMTYFETDLDSGQSKDLAQVTALLASYQVLPTQSGAVPEPATHRANVGLLRSPPPSTEEGTSAFRTVSPSSKEPESMFHASPIQAAFQPASQASFQPASHSQLETGLEDDDPRWDVGDADDNTKRFYGLIPRNLPKQQTVRDVKRHSESRKKKEDDSPPLRVGVIPSDYNDSANHVYENLPQQKTSSAPGDTADAATKYPWMSILTSADANNPPGTQRRRSNLHLITPKPFSLNSKPTPYTSVHSIPSASLYENNQTLNQSDAPLHNHNTQISQSQPSLVSSNFEGSQSNETYKPTEPVRMETTNKTPPPPPVRGTSKLVGQQQSYKDLFTKSKSNRNYEQPVPAILKKGGKTGRFANKHRYMTISSSQPVKLEQSSPHSPKLHSQAGDLISSMDVPDIVKSSTTKSDQYDERTIDREILFFPQKVDIPERYIPDSDDESVTEEEKLQRREKANKIKRILTQQSVHSLSQPDVSKVAGEVHERVQQEKQKRALLLGINQELAEQVKRKSRQYAAERRKTWSGNPHTADMDIQQQQHAETDDENHGDANNNSFNSSQNKYQSQMNNKFTQNSSYRANDSYMGNGNYTGDPYRGNDSSYGGNDNGYGGNDSSYGGNDNGYRGNDDGYGGNDSSYGGNDNYRQGQYNGSGQYDGNDISYSREDNSYSRGNHSDMYSRGDNSDMYTGADNSYSRGDHSDMYSRGDNSDIYTGADNSSGLRYMDNLYSSTSYADRPNFKI